MTKAGWNIVQTMTGDYGILRSGVYTKALEF